MEKRALRLLRHFKPRLIDAVSADPDFLLQHADSRLLVSPAEYRRIRSTADPWQQARDLLDCVMMRGGKDACGMLHLLREAGIQETFPKLAFLREPSQLQAVSESKKGKRRKPKDTEAAIPSKHRCPEGEEMVQDRQLMLLAGQVGRSWRQIGVLALGIAGTKLEQLEEDHPRHVDRVFEMLRMWRMRQGRAATAACLHAILSQGDFGLQPESLDCLVGAG